MVIGLYDEEIQCEVLSNYHTLQTFDSKFQFIEGLEKGRKTKNQLHKEISVTDAFKSQYKRGQNDKKMRKFTNINVPTSPCKVCGSKMHSSLERSTKCQAWGETCNYCGKSIHFKKACMLFARKKPPTFIIDQSKNATSRCSNPSPTHDDTSF